MVKKKSTNSGDIHRWMFRKTDAVPHTIDSEFGKNRRRVDSKNFDKEVANANKEVWD